MAVHGRAHPVPAVISRSSLADAPVLTTPAPVVQQAAATPRFGQPNAGITSRSSLADAAVLATAPPVVVMAAAVTSWGRPQAALIAANPAAPGGAPAAVTPAPVVVAQAAKIAAAQPPVVLRNALLGVVPFTVGCLTSRTDAGLATMGLLDETGTPVLNEGGSFILLENGT